MNDPDRGAQKNRLVHAAFHGSLHPRPVHFADPDYALLALAGLVEGRLDDGNGESVPWFSVVSYFSPQHIARANRIGSSNRFSGGLDDDVGDDIRRIVAAIRGTVEMTLYLPHLEHVARCMLRNHGAS